MRFASAPGLLGLALAGLAATAAAYLFTVLLSMAPVALLLWVFSIVSHGPIQNTGLGMLKAAATWLLACFAAGGLEACVASLRLLLPRSKAFVPTGPRLWSDKQPRLFAEADAMAQSFGIREDLEIYLTADVAIGVAEPSGWLGFNRRAVLVIGLPALQVLSIGSFRALMASCLGRIHGGDTLMSPWIHSMTAAMVRVSRLNQPVPVTGLRAFLFAYGIPTRLAIVFAETMCLRLLVRFNETIRLRQERHADAMACTVAGTRAFVAGLQAIHRDAAALNSYWNGQVAPIVNAGFMPPLAKGFGHFIQIPRIDQALGDSLDSQMNRMVRTPGDAGPLLRDRIAATGLRCGRYSCTSIVEASPARSRRVTIPPAAAPP